VTKPESEPASQSVLSLVVTVSNTTDIQIDINSRIILISRNSSASSPTPVVRGVANDGYFNREPSYTVGGNVSYYNHSGKKFGGYLKS
jgi:hypothetical protein